MNNINKINFYQKNNIEPLKLTGGIQVDEGNFVSFKDTFKNMITELNQVTNKPQQLAQDAMQGKAEVQDVMAAMVQSEMTVQAATTITGKILQTYEKIMQIQI